MADEPITPTAGATTETPVEKKLDEVAEIAEKKADKETDKKPVTLDNLYACIQGLIARFDYFAELVLDSEYIDDDGAVIAVVTPEPEKKPEPAPEKKSETESRPPAKEPEAERTRRHQLV